MGNGVLFDMQAKSNGHALLHKGKMVLDFLSVNPGRASIHVELLVCVVL